VVPGLQNQRLEHRNGVKGRTPILGSIATVETFGVNTPCTGMAGFALIPATAYDFEMMPLF
jgi:hypothetical protein